RCTRRPRRRGGPSAPARVAKHAARGPRTVLEVGSSKEAPPRRRRWIKSPRRSSMPWVWSACSWVKSTASSQFTSASRSCSRKSGEVSIRTLVTPRPLRRSTKSDVRRRRFLGLFGLQAPQPSAGRGTPPEEPDPRIVKLAAMSHASSSCRPLVRAGRLRRDFSEQTKKVLARLPSNRVQRYAARFSHNKRRLNHIGRLIALSPIPAGSQIGGIGLEQDALRRKALRNRAKLIRFFEGHNPRERYEETERDRPPREIATACEAVQHGGESSPPRFLLQYACHILVRLT